MVVIMMNYSDLMISLISKFSRITLQVLEKPLREKDISMQEFRIVGLLIGEEGINQKDLAKKLSVKPATLSVAIDKLVEKGVIERKPSLSDKRVNCLKLCNEVDLTPVNNIVRDIEMQLTAGISKEDLDTTKRVIKTMLSNVNTDV